MLLLWKATGCSNSWHFLPSSDKNTDFNFSKTSSSYWVQDVWAGPESGVWGGAYWRLQSLNLVLHGAWSSIQGQPGTPRFLHQPIQLQTDKRHHWRCCLKPSGLTGEETDSKTQSGWTHTLGCSAATATPARSVSRLPVRTITRYWRRTGEAASGHQALVIPSFVHADNILPQSGLPDSPWRPRRLPACWSPWWPGWGWRGWCGWSSELQTGRQTGDIGFHLMSRYDWTKPVCPVWTGVLVLHHLPPTAEPGRPWWWIQQQPETSQMLTFLLFPLSSFQNHYFVTVSTFICLIV